MNRLKANAENIKTLFNEIELYFSFKFSIWLYLIIFFFRLSRSNLWHAIGNKRSDNYLIPFVNFFSHRIGTKIFLRQKKYQTYVQLFSAYTVLFCSLDFVRFARDSPMIYKRPGVYGFFRLFLSHRCELKTRKGNYIGENFIGCHVTPPVNVLPYTHCCSTRLSSGLRCDIGRPAAGSDLGIEVSSPRHRRSTVIACTTSWLMETYPRRSERRE